MSKSSRSSGQLELPVLVLPEMVLFPRMTMSLALYEERELAILEDLIAAARGPERPRFVFSLSQWDAPYPLEVRPNPVGTLTELVRWDEGASPERKILIRGLERVQISKITRQDPYMKATIEPLERGGWTAPSGGASQEEHLSILRRQAQQIAFSREGTGLGSVLNTLEWIKEAGALADYIAQHLLADSYLKQEILEMTDPAERIRTLLDVLRAGVPEGKDAAEGEK